MPPLKDPDTWTYADAARAVADHAYGRQPAAPGWGEAAASAPKRAYEANRKLIEEKDFWQRGARWIGPGADPTLPAAIRSLTLRRVEPQFTPLDVVGEVVDRAANALVKREPAVQFVPVTPAGKDGAPSDEQLAEAEAMRERIAAWWDRERLWERVRVAVRRELWSGRGVLRYWIPPGMLTDATDDATGQPVRTLPAGLTMAEALERVKLEAPEPHAAAVLTIPDTQERVGVVLTERAGDDGKAVKIAEVWRLTAEGVRIRVLVDRASGGAAAPPDEEYTLPVQRLSVAEMEGEVLITDPVRRQQDHINFVNSTLNRIVETSGFPERTIINAKPQGIWSQTPPASGFALETKELDGTTWYLHPEPRTIGAAITTELHGYPTDAGGDDGKKSFTTPEVVYRDPTDPEYLQKTIEGSRTLLLSGAKQGFVLGNSEAILSGHSRVQARAEFADDLLMRKASIEGALREEIEGVIAIAQVMATADPDIAPDFLSRFRCNVTLHVDAGPITPEERTAILEEYRAGIRSRALTMAMLGTEDPDAELAAIESEEPHRLARMKAYAETLTALASVPGGSVESAARAMVAAGMDETVVTALLPRDTDGLVEDEGGDGDGEQDDPNLTRAA